MSLNKMLALLAAGFGLVVLLGIFVLVIDSGAPSTDELLEERSLVFRYKDAKNRTIRDVATRVEITRGQVTAVLEKASAQTWRITKPVAARADRSAILGILDKLKDIRIESIVEPDDTSPEGLEKFGLKEPRVAAAFWLGDDRHDFQIGSELKGQKTWEKRTYLRLKDDERIFVVANDIAERLDKELKDLRDKRVFDRDRDAEKATALQIASTARTLTLKRDKATWSLEHKAGEATIADRADASKITGLLTKARNLEAQDYVDETGDKLAEYGLDKPQATCVVTDQDGQDMTLLIGKATADDAEKLYAKRSGEAAVFSIKKEFLTDVDVKLDDVRDRHVAVFESDDVTGIEVAHGDATWTMARTNKDADWKIAKPREAEAEGTDVDDFLKDIGRLRVARWVDDPADKAQEHLKSPDMVLTLLREPEDKPGARKQPPVKLTFSGLVEIPKPKAQEPEKKEDKTGEDKAKDKEKKDDVEEGRYVRREGQAGLLFITAGKAPADATTEQKDSTQSANDLAKATAKGYLAFLGRQVFDFDNNDVVRLILERAGGAKVVCEKKDDDWKVTSPAALDAKKANMDTILGAFNDLSADEYIAENPKDLKAYGLDAPLLRLTASIEEEVKDDAKKDKDEDKGADEKKDEAKKPEKKPYAKTLLVSRKVDGKTHGMEQGGTLVFALKSWDVTSLQTEVIDTTLADFTDTDATGLMIAHRGKPELVLEKKDDAWQITKPKEAEADQDAVKKIIDALHDLRGRRCIDYEAKDLKPYGLDPAGIVVTVKIKDKSDFVLELGTPVADAADDPGSHGLEGGDKKVFLVAKGKVDDIAKTLADLEKKPEPKKEDDKVEKKDEKKAGEEKPAEKK